MTRNWEPDAGRVMVLVQPRAAYSSQNSLEPGKRRLVTRVREAQRQLHVPYCSEVDLYYCRNGISTGNQLAALL